VKAILRLGLVVVIEGAGFAASIKRSAITLINMATSLPYPTKVVATLGEGAEAIVKVWDRDSIPARRLS